MNTNPKAKRILCYGDSLTNGFDPETDRRLDSNSRWTGVLQNLLGNNYEIIEEGLGGRTTEMDDPKEKGRNGLVYFYNCLASHFPLDIVVIMLGTNDLKDRFSKSTSEIAKSLSKYYEKLKLISQDEGVGMPKVIIMSPPHITQSFVPASWDFSEGEAKSKQLANEYRELSSKIGASFIDLSEIVTASNVDGVHLNAQANNTIAVELSKLITAL